MPEILSYATSYVSQVTWTNGANVVGPPDAVYASQNNTAGSTLTLGVAGFSALPGDAVIREVYLGVRMEPTGAGSTLLMRLQHGATVYPYVRIDPAPGPYSVPRDFESQWMGGFMLTASAAKQADFQAQVRKETSTGIVKVDAVWVRIVYELSTSAVKQSYRHASSVVSGTWPSNTNMVGAPNGTTASSTTPDQTALLAMSGLTDIPADATLVEARMGARWSRSTAIPAFDFYLQPPAAGAVYIPMPQPPSTNLFDSEVVLDPVRHTLAMLKDTALQLQLRKTGASGASAIDAVWVRALYTLPSAARAKRWDGDSWEDAAIKRWDGSQWVTPTVKRWDGSAWV